MKQLLVLMSGTNISYYNAKLTRLRILIILFRLKSWHSYMFLFQWLPALGLFREAKSKQFSHVAMNPFISKHGIVLAVQKIKTSKEARSNAID